MYASSVLICTTFTDTCSYEQIKYEELPLFSEILACGTAVTVIPIRSITRKSRGDKFDYLEGNKDRPGPCATMLARALGDFQKGNVDDEFGWLVGAEMPEAPSRHRNTNSWDTPTVAISRFLKGIRFDIPGMFNFLFYGSRP